MMETKVKIIERVEWGEKMVDRTHSYNHWRDSEEQGWENKMAEE